MREFAGEGVYCPVCQSTFRTFAPFFAWQYFPTEKPADTKPAWQCVENDWVRRCPSCQSLERQRLLWLFLMEKMNLTGNLPLRLLEFAPDIPFLSYFSSLTGLEYHPCDLNPGQARYQSCPGRVRAADITAIPYPEGFFDVILCNHVLEHVEDDRKAMQELYRVMRPGGWGVFQVPLDQSRELSLEDEDIQSPEDREKYYGQVDHCRLYGKDYPKRLEEAGFRVRVVRFPESFSDEEKQKYGLDPGEDIYFVRKA
jgi:SAM-dependent methyltransferase